MALTNNEKQIRHKKLEALKKYGNDVLIQMIFLNTVIDSQFDKTNEELKTEIETIVNLPAGWTDEDYDLAVKKIRTMNITALGNPHLMDNDISAARSILHDPDFNPSEIKRAQYKAAEVVRNIKSTLKLSELKVTDQIAAIAEVMRFLGIELTNEKSIPKTFANATALSLIDFNYDKPSWTWEVLAQNLYNQNSKEKAELIAKELTNPDLEDKWGFV